MPMSEGIHFHTLIAMEGRRSLFPQVVFSCLHRVEEPGRLVPRDQRRVTLILFLVAERGQAIDLIEPIGRVQPPRMTRRTAVVAVVVAVEMIDAFRQLKNA